MDSKIVVNSGGTTFVGPDATRLFQAKVIRRAILSYVKTGMKMNRAYTPTNMLATAASITGLQYKRGQLQKAADDLNQWILACEAAMPVETQ